jgi:hypothetical protein
MSTSSSLRNPYPILLLALGVGIALGLAIGWLAPVQRFTTGFDLLHPDYKADYVVMVGNAFLMDGDWPTAEARLEAIGEPDLASYVGELAESAIADGRNLNDIRGLVALSAQLGYTSPVMQPHLPAQAPGG